MQALETVVSLSLLIALLSIGLNIVLVLRSKSTALAAVLPTRPVGAVSSSVGEDLSEEMHVETEAAEEIFQISERSRGLEAFGANRVSFNPQRRFSISNTLSQMPNFIGQVSKALPGQYTVQFSKAGAAGMKAGKLSLMSAKGGGLRPTLVDAGGKIRGGVKLARHGVNMMNVAGAAWQVAAMITAQRFLADIDKKLAALSSGVKSIERWLESEEEGRIAGAHQYLCSVLKCLKQSEINDSDAVLYSQATEQIILESYKGIEANLIRVIELNDDIVRFRSASGIESTVKTFDPLVNKLLGRSSAGLADMRNMIEAIAVAKALGRSKEIEEQHVQYLSEVAVKFHEQVVAALDHSRNVIDGATKSLWTEFSAEKWAKYKVEQNAAIAEMRSTFVTNTESVKLILQTASQAKQEDVDVAFLLEVGEDKTFSITGAERVLVLASAKNY